jgi:enoyl-CoA hydratase/carnithine racemase
MPFAHLAIGGSIATISLDHPKGNRINFAMREDLLTTIRQVAVSDVRVLVIRAEGDDFCLGGDVHDWPGIPARELRPKIETFAEALNQLEGLSIPTVAVVQGRCMGGGLELILSCDLVVATESAVFSCPEALLGIVTLQGGVIQLAERIGRARALEFAFLSDLHSADEMARLNLINRVVPDDQLEDACRALADRLASGPPAAYATTKLLMRTWAAGGLAAARSILYDVSMPLFEADEVQTVLQGAAAAAKEGRPFPKHEFSQPRTL